MENLLVATKSIPQTTRKLLRAHAQFDDEHDQAHKKHHNADFINRVHGSQVKVRLGIRVGLAEEIAKHWTQVHVVLQSVFRGILASISTRGGIG